MSTPKFIPGKPLGKLFHCKSSALSCPDEGCGQLGQELLQMTFIHVVLESTHHLDIQLSLRGPISENIQFLQP